MSKRHLKGYVVTAALSALGGGIGAIGLLNVAPKMVARLSECSA